MNVLVLTPDRVGSTLLQRLLTIYMVKKGFGKPVINLHELSNGILKYYNTTLCEYVLGKPQKDQWNYNQSLAEIVGLLSTVDHFKTTRLAHYHLKARKDSPDDLEKFYQYLNENFYIISCRRTNLFEQALSWSIVAHSKQLNVYDPRSKFDTFNDIYHHGIIIGKDIFIDNLNAYQDYLLWADQNFNIQSYFVYDEHVHDLESYIATLDFMQGKAPTWKQMFGQDFKSYNTCHKLLPDLAIQQSNVARLSFDTSKIKNYPLSKVSVDQNQHAFLQKNLDAYLEATDHIAELVNTGYLITGIPIKLQSLAEKRAIVTNFQQCVLWYNTWCKANKIDRSLTDETLLELADQETQKMVVAEGLEPPLDSV